MQNSLSGSLFQQGTLILPIVLNFDVFQFDRSLTYRSVTLCFHYLR